VHDGVGDALADDCLADALEQDPADGAGADLLIDEGGVEDGAGVEAGGGFGQAEAADEGLLALEVGVRQQAEFGGDDAGGAHADGDGFAVEVGPVAGDGLDGVADRVAVVQEGAAAGFAFIFGDDGGLDGDRAGDQVGRGEGRAIDGGCFEVADEGLVEDEAVLEEFGPAVAELAVGEGAEEEGVDDDGARLREGADEVLAAGVVDAGFAADGSVGHGEEGGGRVEEGDAAEDGGCGEPGEVGDDAAAEGDDEVRPLNPVVDEEVVDGGEGLEVFVLFTRRDGEARGRVPGGFERGPGAGGEEGADGGVGDDEGSAVEGEVAADGAEGAEGSFADEDGVGSAGGSDDGGGFRDNAGPGLAGGGVRRVEALAGRGRVALPFVPEPPDLLGLLLRGEVVAIDGSVGAAVEVDAGLEERLEAGAGVASEQGPLGAAGGGEDALRGDGRGDGEPDDEAGAEDGTGGGNGGSAPAGRDDDWLARGGPLEGAEFALAEGRLALRGEQLGDGAPGLALNLVVGVDELPAEAAGEDTAGGGLAAAGEADEEDAARDHQLLRARGPMVARNPS